jgi:hypothetical protein
MFLDASQWFLLVGGLLCTIFGGLVVFSDRFLAKIQRTIWKQNTKLDKTMFPDGGHVFNRYGRGLGLLTLGIGLLWIFVRSMLN